MAKVLYVEDEDMLRRAVSRMVQRSRHEFLVVGSRDQAREVFDRETFDVVIADYYLEYGFTGVQLLQELKIKKPTLKCVVTSGGCPPIEESWILELHKPFNLEELDKTLDEVLG